MVESIPTGSLSLDLALGIGGLPKGRIVKSMGRSPPVKTTLALHVVAEAQKWGRGGLHRRRARPGPHLRPGAGRGHRLHAHLPARTPASRGLEICEALVRSGAIDVVVVDSVAALTPGGD